MAIHLPEMVRQVLYDNLTMDPAELALHRCRELTRWTIRAGQLVGKEKEFKAGLAPHLKVLLARKRLLVFQEMLEQLKYPDKHLVRDIANGFRLMGWQEKTGVFPPCVKRPSFSLDTLRRMAQGLRQDAGGSQPWLYMAGFGVPGWGRAFVKAFWIATESR